MHTESPLFQNCFQPLNIWKAVTDHPVSNISKQADKCRLFESITLLLCSMGSGIFTQKASVGEIDTLSKEAIVLYLNIERPIVPLSGSQHFWHYSGMKPSWCVCFSVIFFCSLLFLESYVKGYPFIWREINETVNGVHMLQSFSLSVVVTVCTYILSFWRVFYTLVAMFFFHINIMVSWAKKFSLLMSSVCHLPLRDSLIGRSVNQTLMALHTECFTSEKSSQLT